MLIEDFKTKSFRIFLEGIFDFDPGFPKQILQDFFGMVDRFFKHPKNRERVLQGGKGMQY